MHVRVEAVRRIGSAEGDTISSTSQTNGFVGNDKDQHAFSVPNRSTVGYPGLQVSVFFRVLRVRERWRRSRVSSIPNAICPPIHSQTRILFRIGGQIGFGRRSGRSRDRCQGVLRNRGVLGPPERVMDAWEFRELVL